MKFLFIQSNGFVESLGVVSLAACLEKAGHKVELLLMSHCRNFFSALKDYQPDIIGFSAVTGAHEEIMGWADLIKSHMDIPIVVGGPHATYYPEEIIPVESVDYICRGEGEIALVALVNRLQEGRDAYDIPNIWTRRDNGWIQNELGPLIENLDSLPMPKREIYYKYPFLRNMTMKRFLSGLGCPYSCTFCHNTLTMREYKGKGRYVRRKSVQRVIDEILQVKRVSALKMIHFTDELFTVDRNWLIEFAQKYPAQVGIQFSCNLRLDCLLEDVDLLAKAGCKGATFGFESGSERVRKSCLKKFFTNEQAREVIQRFKKYNIETMSNNMISLPGETMEDVISTIEWNEKIGFKYARVAIFLPFPKLELSKIAKERSLLQGPLSLKEFKLNSANPVFNKEYANELINLSNLFLISIKLKFLRPFLLKYIIRMRPNKLFQFAGWVLDNLQYYFFFHLRPFSTWNYYRNALRVYWHNVAMANSPAKNLLP